MTVSESNYLISSNVYIYTDQCDFVNSLLRNGLDPVSFRAYKYPVSYALRQRAVYCESVGAVSAFNSTESSCSECPL